MNITSREMFSRLSSSWRYMFKFSGRGFANHTYTPNISHWQRKMTAPLLGLSYFAFMPGNINLQEDNNQSKQPINSQQIKSVGPKIKPKTIWERIWYVITHIVRFFHLVIIFTPPVFLLPLLLFKRTNSYWMDVFVKAIERAGVVFIKAFQYLSHRRDIIGEQLAAKFEYLREKAPTHQLQITKQYFRESYNKNIQDIFEEFDPEPIASGSVSQVYKAKYRGKKVAVKVRHPNVDKYIERDINLLFFLSYIASIFSPAMEIPVSDKSLKKTLIEQIDFTFQMHNLNKFNSMFRYRSDINFPQPFEENTKDSVLVQTFVEGVPVTYYQTHPHPLNKIIARLGSTTFFEMLMKNNFIHADCHGGNILIEIRQQSYNFFTELRDTFKQIMFAVQTKLKSMNFDTEKIKNLYVSSRKEQLQILKMIRKYKQKIVVNVIDVGMVIQLNERDKKNFVNFIKSVIEGRGELCAEMIYNLSNFQGKKIMIGKFDQYYNQLEKCFSILNNQALDDLKGMTLFIDMLTIIRQNKMKLDGQFATLLTNMMVLEAIAKDIDPEINILKCAFPYFKYVEDFGVYTK